MYSFYIDIYGSKRDFPADHSDSFYLQCQGSCFQQSWQAAAVGMASATDYPLKWHFLSKVLAKDRKEEWRRSLTNSFVFSLKIARESCTPLKGLKTHYSMHDLYISLTSLPLSCRVWTRQCAIQCCIALNDTKCKEDAKAQEWCNLQVLICRHFTGTTGLIILPGRVCKTLWWPFPPTIPGRAESLPLVPPDWCSFLFSVSAQILCMLQSHQYPEISVRTCPSPAMSARPQNNSCTGHGHVYLHRPPPQED